MWVYVCEYICGHVYEHVCIIIIIGVSVSTCVYGHASLIMFSNYCVGACGVIASSFNKYIACAVFI